MKKAREVEAKKGRSSKQLEEPSYIALYFAFLSLRVFHDSRF